MDAVCYDVPSYSLVARISLLRRVLVLARKPLKTVLIISDRWDDWGLCPVTRWLLLSGG